MFQGVVDVARIKLDIDCAPLPEPVWVDRDMWEKIVSNLVSNAFKFTMTGEIAVRTRDDGAHFVLEVADTGVGIPETELPRIFDRFHRVAGAIGRTHEGTGIGLALVRELVEPHGGHVTVESVVGRGTLFRVTIPKGFAHLPADAVLHDPVDTRAARGASAHAAEAARWAGRPPMPERPSPPAGIEPAWPRRRHVLVVEDNADLREYVSGLLAGHFEVTTAADGLEAVEAVRKRAPDIVVSDVMMPRLDGLGLVRELRANASTASLPIILLSARAGEESAIVGLDVGADDYLMKPFSAAELIARVRTHVELARVRRDLITDLEQTNRELDAFSYSVSHDLRAPLRAMSGFAQILVEDYAKALDGEGMAHVERICNGANRMSTLVDDLLGLSRISRAPVSTEDVDLSDLAKAIVADLRYAQPAREVDLEIEARMVVRGDRPLLRIALGSLLGNAWKYTSRRANPKVEFRRSPGAGDTFLIRDNGAGFDMATAAGGLFAPFRRFHRASDFEGTGIGLATVQRIIARHRGRVWAEAELDRGATFFFSLPG
jgi:signal transduction histidine kinase